MIYYDYNAAMMFFKNNDIEVHAVVSLKPDQSNYRI